MKGIVHSADEILEPTAASRHQTAVERVIAAMREEALSLRDMADIAHLSPYHFTRTFKKVTGASPGEFLTAWRLERAKQLLLSTDLGVAEICHESGYESPGTFASRFKRLVGLPPGAMRRLPEELYAALGRADGRIHALPATHTEAGVAFQVRASGLTGSMIFTGLFPSTIPQGRPAAGMILEAPGTYRLHPVPDGLYYLMAAALPRSQDPWQLLLPGDGLRVGRARHPVAVRGGRASGRADVALRPVHGTDPPVLIALPALLLERLVSADGDP